MMRIKKAKSSRLKWKRRDLIVLFERLGMYISSGLSLAPALAIAETGSNARQKACIENIRLSVEKGNQLSRSMSDHMKISSSVIGLISHGESSGSLVASLDSARTLIEREDALIKTCVSALAYPCVIGVFAILMTVGLMRGVMPQIIPLLLSLHVDLPLLTRIMIYISVHLALYGTYGLLLIVIGIPLALFCYRKIKIVKAVTHAGLIRTPIVGRFALTYTFSLLLRSLGSLVEAGAPSASSYRDVVSTVQLYPVRAWFDRQSESVSRGVPLAQIFSTIRKMPAYVPSLISAGEASGTLGQSLIRSANIIDRDMEHALKRLTGLVEPVMMAGMGCAVGAIAISIMLPIYDVSKVLQH